MKTVILALVLSVCAEAGVVRLVVPPAVQKAGHAVLVSTHKVRHWIWKVVW